MSIVAFFSQNYKNKQTFFWRYCTKHHQVCTRCSNIQCTSKLPNGVLIFKTDPEWQHNNENFSVKNADFATLISCHGNIP